MRVSKNFIIPIIGFFFFFFSTKALNAQSCKWYATELYCFDCDCWIDTHCCGENGTGNVCNCLGPCTFDCQNPPPIE